MAFPINASLNSKFISNTYVDTDCDQIANIALEYGAKIIKRPEYLAGDTVDHGDVIRYSCNEVLKKEKVDVFVILLGNTVMIDHELIDKSIKTLTSDVNATGVCSVWKAGDDHPMRAMEIKNGYLFSHPSVIRQKGASTDRASYLPAYFYDQGVWTFLASNLNLNNGPATWNWLGERVIPLEREWITGRDINGPFDVNFHRNWELLKNIEGSFKILEAKKK